MKLDVFDPPMCCSSGVCGPTVDPERVRFAADLEWVKKQGVTVSRFNLAQQPLAFAQNDTVREALQEDGGALPLVLVDGRVVCRGKYPTAEEMAVSTGVSLPGRAEPPRQKTPAQAELAEGATRAGRRGGPARAACCGARTARGNRGTCCG